MVCTWCRLSLNSLMPAFSARLTILLGEGEARVSFLLFSFKFWWVEMQESEEVGSVEARCGSACSPSPSRWAPR